ncbi:MAG: hypothetical protein RIS88_1891 [Pseudomonadota bacterium]|jgi:uncharacterized protein YgbK (DUF1537 family)
MSLRLAFFGDDFTGSTDALEVLAFAGLRTALFLAPPGPQALARTGPLDAFGVAGDSRAMTPQEMDAALPPVFDALAASGAPIVHYKVCSTFDSAPGIGSIGRAIALARGRFGSRCTPVVGGTPSLRRYCAFGHLFARSATDDRVYRIDRHPIMKSHPVTPMDESDLLQHIGRQEPLALANLPYPEIDHGPQRAAAVLDAAVAAGADAVVMDSLNESHLTSVGGLLAREAARGGPLFVVGPSGVEYALTQHWRESGELPAAAPRFDAYAGVDRVLAISASASLLSARQVDAAVQAGFTPLAVEVATLLSAREGEGALDSLIEQTLRALRAGHSVILHTARGPDDPRIAQAIAALAAQAPMAPEAARHEAGRRTGQLLGRLAREVLQQEPLRRLLLSGGDTSSRVVQALAPDALLVTARLTPGAPLCRLVSRHAWLDGLEVALKGGQMGDTGFFETARTGRR